MAKAITPIYHIHVHVHVHMVSFILPKFDLFGWQDAAAAAARLLTRLNVLAKEVCALRCVCVVV